MVNPSWSSLQFKGRTTLSYKAGKLRRTALLLTAHDKSDLVFAGSVVGVGEGRWKGNEARLDRHNGHAGWKLNQQLTDSCAISGQPLTVSTLRVCHASGERRLIDNSIACNLKEGGRHRRKEEVYCA